MKYLKTEAGQAAFKERSSLFSPRQRSMFILVDGNKHGEQLLAAGMGITQADIDYLVEQGFLASVPEPVGPAVADDSQWTSREGAISVRSGRTEQDRYKEAKPLATQLTAGLGLRGFMLNLSVESASGYQELIALLPKIQDAVGNKACRALETALLG